MTDGHTGIQVAPITEDDMSRVHDILRRAVDAIVGMSQLSRDVDDMRGQMAQMSDDMDRLRRTNNALEESLDSSRRARQAAEASLNDALARANHAEDSLASASRDADHWQKSANGLLDQISAIKRERDDAQFHELELQDQLKQAQATLAKVKDIFGVVEAPKAVPQATPEPVASPQYTPTVSAASPIPSQDEHSGPSRTYVDGYQAGAFWDSDRGQYYIES